MPPPQPFDPPAEELDLSPQGPAVSVENVLHTWGGVYIGEWAADQPHGRGTLQLRNGQVRVVRSSPHPCIFSFFSHFFHI